MKTIKTLLGVCLVLLLTATAVVAENDETFESTTLWVGSHYVDFNDYYKMLGEYTCGEDEWMPELGLNFFSRSGNSIFRLDGRYNDENDVFANARSTIGDRFKFHARFRNLIHQKGQDMLANLEAREFFESTGLPGGKILTHEVTDPGADYNYKRREILTELEVLLSRKNNVRLSATHRTILKDGEDQSIASNHCFSCHVTAKGVEVEQRQHQIEVGIDADVAGTDVGYRFGYRRFKSNVADPMAYYDPAKHPVNGGSASEFSSRQLFDDTTLPYSTLPTTEKMSHKVRFKTGMEGGSLAASLGYSIAKNTETELTSKAYAGAVKYARRINDRTRLVARAAMTMLKASDPWIDLPTFRDGAADLNEASFDFTRFSSLDRWDTRLSAEVISKLNPKTTFYILGEFNRTDRDDYPIYDDGTVTSEIIGQAKLRYRKGLRYSTMVKYRFEKIIHPFVSARGLFELPGYDILEPIIPISPWIFYFQREELRYQDITSLPNMIHIFEWNSSYRPSGQYNLNLGMTAKYDKNTDLDTLEVMHFSLRPNVNINYIPDMKWSLAGGYAYTWEKSKLPVTVALFDG